MKRNMLVVSVYLLTILALLLKESIANGNYELTDSTQDGVEKVEPVDPDKVVWSYVLGGDNDILTESFIEDLRNKTQEMCKEVFSTTYYLDRKKGEKRAFEKGTVVHIVPYSEKTSAIGPYSKFKSKGVLELPVWYHGGVSSYFIDDLRRRVTCSIYENYNPLKKYTSVSKTHRSESGDIIRWNIGLACIHHSLIEPKDQLVLFYRRFYYPPHSSKIINSVEAICIFDLNAPYISQLKKFAVGAEDYIMDTYGSDEYITPYSDFTFKNSPVMVAKYCTTVDNTPVFDIINLIPPKDYKKLPKDSKRIEY